jgi:hypothetical protein
VLICHHTWWGISRIPYATPKLSLIKPTFNKSPITLVRPYKRYMLIGDELPVKYLLHAVRVVLGG